MPTCPGCCRSVAHRQLPAHQRYCRGIRTDRAQDPFTARSVDQLARTVDAMAEQVEALERAVDEVEAQASTATDTSTPRQE